MKRAVVSTVAAIAVAALCLSTPALAQKLAGQYGFSLHTGLVIANKLYADDPSDPSAPRRPERRLGIIPLGGGLHYFINNNVMGGLDLAFTRFPKWIELWGPDRTWSMLELGAHLKYIITPSSNISLYGKFGLKMARLRGSIKPGKGLFGGTVGYSLETGTAFAPGVELAVGLLGLPSQDKGMVAGFAEVAFSYLWTKRKDVRANGEAAAWKYPFNLELCKLRIGLMFLVGGKRNQP